MPRPKVHPNERRRAVKACGFCRASKKRCSGTVPCTACRRRGMSSSCSFGHASIGTETTANAQRVNRDAGGGRSFGARTTSFGAESRPRMLLNRRGDRVFIGEAASISFLQFLRATVSNNIGPSQFSHNAQSDRMLETQPPGSAPSLSDHDIANISAEEITGYFTVYNSATAGLVQVLSPEEVQSFLNRTDKLLSDDSLMNPVIRDLVIAIGAQCKSLVDSRRVGQECFRRAQVAAFSGMLEDPGIDLVRAFLLMSFYMLGHCRRNAAFMYLGTATRAAISIGLHSCEAYSVMGSPENRLRMQVWMSLCNLDILVSSILGRPAATMGLPLGFSERLLSEDMAGVTASFRILVIINHIIDVVYVNKDKSSVTAERLLGKLKEWSRSLPKSFCSDVSPESSKAQKEKENIAKIHISCLYYFAVTLVTRPILMSTLTTTSSSERSALSQISSACLDAAVYLAQTCMEGHTKAMMLGNMCIIKALTFAAGLILGFAIFAEQTRDCGVEAAFDGAKDVLGFLAAQSPQACHYLEILTLLSRAIDKQRQRQTARGRNKYVGRIFQLDEGGTSTALGADDDDLVSPSSSQPGDVIVQEERDAPDGNESMPGLDSVDENFPSAWDMLELSLWDNFPFVEPINWNQLSHRLDNWIVG
ncbi:hypothetical protein CONLIGDRAFT_688771 [Coniochaeta ligniaria NRRL 30616]|uniref:Zn(2)-C6 fungal-type domain-containing protein n=1 Tax=Coniochaeta ligniaria NRRL 30616 TaxID=1408157 RepID=A0A1J7J3Y9_9PEZI|nr:hypothetical protein CONLIGDRAFT_688771 [Coniochaeta ligniaria NRRL 30616]